MKTNPSYTLISGLTVIFFFVVSCFVFDPSVLASGFPPDTGFSAESGHRTLVKVYNADPGDADGTPEEGGESYDALSNFSELYGMPDTTLTLSDGADTEVSPGAGTGTVAPEPAATETPDDGTDGNGNSYPWPTPTPTPSQSPGLIERINERIRQNQEAYKQKYPNGVLASASPGSIDVSPSPSSDEVSLGGKG